MLDGNDEQNNSEPIINRRRFLASSAATSVGLAAGCMGGGTKQVTIGIPHYGFNWDTSMPYVVGNEKGFFDEEGVKTSKLEVGGGGKNVRAVVAGDANIALGTGVFALFAAHRKGTGIRIPSNEINAASDLFWVAKSGSKYKSLEDLKGESAKIGFSSPGSSTNMVALGAINHGNLDNAKAVAVGGPPDSLTALKTDEIDVGWLTAEFVFDPAIRKDVQMVFKGMNIPPFGATTIRANVATDKWLSNNSKAAKSYFRARQKTIDWAYSNKEKAAEIMASKFDKKNGKEIFTKALEAGAYGKEHLQMNAFKGLDTANQLAVKHGFLDNKLPQKELNKLIDTSYLPGTDGDTFA